MIIVKDGQYAIEGSTAELLSELTQVLRVFYKEEILNDERTKHLLALANKSDEQIYLEAEEIKANQDTLTKLFGDLLEGED